MQPDNMTPGDLAHNGVSKKILSDTEVTPSSIGFGAMELAGPPRGPNLNQNEAIKLLHGALEMGITYFDTSIDYGTSEELIGIALSKYREKFILATKCGCQPGKEVHGEGSHIYTDANIRAGISQSLKRLQSDHIDVIQLHGNPTREVLESQGGLEALLDLKGKGVIKHIGLSTRKPYVDEFLNLDPLELFQIPYSAIQRQHEDTIETLSETKRIVVARGITGRGSVAKSWMSIPIGMKDGQAKSVWEAAGMDEILGGMSRLEFMIRFAITNPHIDISLTGTSNLDHLRENLEAASKGPLEQELYKEAKRRLALSGSSPGDTNYERGGPKPTKTVER